MAGCKGDSGPSLVSPTSHAGAELLAAELGPTGSPAGRNARPSGHATEAHRLLMRAALHLHRGADAVRLLPAPVVGTGSEALGQRGAHRHPGVAGVLDGALGLLCALAGLETRSLQVDVVPALPPGLVTRLSRRRLLLLRRNRRRLGRFLPGLCHPLAVRLERLALLAHLLVLLQRHVVVLNGTCIVPL